MKFIESKFTALEFIRKQEKETTTSVSVPMPLFSRRPARFNDGFNKSKTNYQNRSSSKNYQNATLTRRSICYMSHLFQCKRCNVLNVRSISIFTLKTIAYIKTTDSSILHNPMVQHVHQTCQTRTKSKRASIPINKKYKVRHVAKDNGEIFTNHMSLWEKLSKSDQIKAHKFLLCQKTQPRCYACNVFNIINRYQVSNSLWSSFSTQTLVMLRVINNLPNYAIGIRDASTYVEFIISGSIKGPANAPIAQHN